MVDDTGVVGRCDEELLVGGGIDAAVLLGVSKLVMGGKGGGLGALVLMVAMGLPFTAVRAALATDSAGEAVVGAKVGAGAAGVVVTGAGGLVRTTVNAGGARGAAGFFFGAALPAFMISMSWLFWLRAAGFLVFIFTEVELGS
jgi:hypothetical protein